MPITESTSTVRVLMLHDSKDQAEALINDIRNLGYATRAHLIEDEVDLLNALNQSTWDIMLARPETDDISAYSAIKHIQAKDKDIPTLILTDSNDSEAITKGLRYGAQDVVPVGENERLRLIFQRELVNSNERKKRRSIEIKLHETEKRCNLLLDSSRDAITYIHDGMHIYANEAYIELFGYQDKEDLEGMPIMDMIASRDKEQFKHMLRDYRDFDGPAELTCYGLRLDEAEIKAHMIFSTAFYDNEPCTQIILRVDRGNAELEAKLKAISTQDLLTGLGNRSYFSEQLDQIITANAENNRSSSLLYICLDAFGDLKSTLGLSKADMVITDIAHHLTQHFENNNTLSRYSDDVFTVIISGSTDEANNQAEPMVRNIAEHIYQAEGESTQVTVSTGIAIISDQAPKGEKLISRAYKAMSEVRSNGGNGVKLHIPQQNTPNPENIPLTDQLKQAIDNKQLSLLFQPVIDLRGSNSELYEALVRMKGEQGKTISAGDLLAAADSKLCEKIDRWVILKSIKLLTEQREAGHKTRLFINLTRASVQDKTFLPWLSVAFKAARLSTDAVIFQITENDITSTLKEARLLTKSLQEIHCQVAINRFGCSLNPFNSLKHLNVEYLKIDPSFSKDLSSNESKEALKEIVATAHSQGKLTIIPYVENATILSTLWQIGANYVQGHYLQAPMESMNYDFSDDS